MYHSGQPLRRSEESGAASITEPPLYPIYARTALQNMKNDKVITKRTKARQRPKQVQLRDVFTIICKTDIGVDCVKEYKFHPKRMWRFDYAIPEHKIALEVEGGVWTQGRHTRPQGFLGDIEKYNTATLMGWRVFRTTPEDLYRLATINLLKNAIFGTNSPGNSTFSSEK